MVNKKEDGNSKGTGKKGSKKLAGNKASPAQGASSAKASATGKGQPSTVPQKANGKSQVSSAVGTDAKKVTKSAAKPEASCGVRAAFTVQQW